MNSTTIFNEFIYNMHEEQELKALKENLIEDPDSAQLTPLKAAKLLLQYLVLAPKPESELHAILLERAVKKGNIRRYLAHTITLLQSYLPSRQEFLATITSTQGLRDIALYQNYCAWKENYLDLTRAGLVSSVVSPLDIAKELTAELSTDTALDSLLTTMDNHEEASRAIDAFLAEPLTKSAPERAKELTASFLTSLNKLKKLNYPLCYNSLAEFVTATHGKASRALTLLLSAEKLYHLESSGLRMDMPLESGVELGSIAIDQPSTSAQKKRNSAHIIIPLIATIITLVVGASAYLFFGAPAAKHLPTPPAATKTAALIVSDAASDKAAPQIQEAPLSPLKAAAENSQEPKEAIAQEATKASQPLATIYAATSAGVKTCASGPLTSIDCPENRRGFLLKGDQVTILAENEAGWSKIEAADGQVWWVFSGFLQGSENMRKWRPVAPTSKNARIFEDEALKEPSRFTLQSDGSYCARKRPNNRWQVATPGKVLGFIGKNRLKEL